MRARQPGSPGRRRTRVSGPRPFPSPAWHFDRPGRQPCRSGHRLRHVGTPGCPTKPAGSHHAGHHAARADPVRWTAHLVSQSRPRDPIPVVDRLKSQEGPGLAGRHPRRQRIHRRPTNPNSGWDVPPDRRMPLPGPVAGLDRNRTRPYRTRSYDPAHSSPPAQAPTTASSPESRRAHDAATSRCRIRLRRDPTGRELYGEAQPRCLHRGWPDSGRPPHRTRSTSSSAGSSARGSPAPRTSLRHDHRVRSVRGRAAPAPSPETFMSPESVGFNTEATATQIPRRRP
ncbi:hypothetical protein SAMN04487982_110236 [Streptomyces sp. ok210]|nr:hypothetical protein SAMN04487982_110236 [Streptomyces sp. ok210]